MIIIAVSTLFICLIMFVATFKGSFFKEQTIILILMIVVSLSIFGATKQPKEIYDLYRHYEAIDRVRASSMTLTRFLKDGYTITNYNYRHTYLFNILLFVIARFLPNQALPFITVLITYSCFSYILISELGEEYLSNRRIVFSIAFFSILLPYLYVYSNIRNALAAAIASVGIYRLFKQKKIVLFFICTISAVLVHPVVLAIIPFILLSKVRPGIIGIILITVIPSILFPIMEFFRLKFNNYFLFWIAAKYYNYTLVRVDNQGRGFLFSTVIILLVFVILAVTKSDNISPIQENDRRLINVITWYSLFSLVYVRNYEIITRLPYLIAFLGPVISKVFLNDKLHIRNKNTLYEGVVYGLSLLGIYLNIAWLV